MVNRRLSLKLALKLFLISIFLYGYISTLHDDHSHRHHPRSDSESCCLFPNGDLACCDLAEQVCTVHQVSNYSAELRCESVINVYMTVIGSTLTIEFLRPTNVTEEFPTATIALHEDMPERESGKAEMIVLMPVGILSSLLVFYLLTLAYRRRRRRRVGEETEAVRNGVELSGGYSEAGGRVAGGGDVEPPPPYGADTEVLLVGPDMGELPYYDEEEGRERRNEDGRELNSQSTGDNNSEPMSPPNAHLAPG